MENVEQAMRQETALHTEVSAMRVEEWVIGSQNAGTQTNRRSNGDLNQRVEVVAMTLWRKSMIAVKKVTFTTDSLSQ